MALKLRVYILLFIIIFTYGCSEKRTIVQDNTTANLNINSVAQSENTDILEGNEKFSAGDFYEAIKLYEKASKENKATAFYNIGVSYYLLNNTPMAELNFREAVNSDPDFPEAVMNLIAVLAEQGGEKAKEAEKYVEKYIDKANHSAAAYSGIANVFLSVNDTAKAMYYYKKALEKDASSPMVLENYANLLISIGEYEDGITLLESLPSRNFIVHYNLANAYFAIGNKESAYSNAQEALYSDGASETGYDKLAHLFNKLKKYSDEAQTLRILISGNDERDYRVRLIKAYLSLAENDKAVDEIDLLLKEYPRDEELSLLKYNVMVYIDTAKAGEYIKSLYEDLKTDKVLSYYAKHVCYFNKTQNEIRPYIQTNRNNGWISLAKTVYALKQGRYKDAETYLKSAGAENGHDYFAYNTFLNVKNRDFARAASFAANLDLLQYDTFWYKLVIAWNLREPQTVLSLGEEYRNSSLISIRPPSFEFNIRPVLDDMSFTYRFDDKSIDAASMLAYPVFMKPDETTQFLITGRSALKERDRDSVTSKLEGIKMNNAAIDDFASFNFESAKQKFEKAAGYLTNNTIVLYNLALTYFNLGENDKAKEVIDKAFVIDKNDGFTHLISGLLNYRKGNYPDAKLNFDQAKLYASKKIGELEKPEDEDIMLLYLSVLSSDRPSKRSEAESIYKSNDNGFTVSCALLMDYFDDYDIEKLNELKDSPIFRVSRVRNLLALRHTPIDQFKDVDDADRYYTLAYKFAMLQRGAADAVIFNKRFARDKVYLKDMVYVSVYRQDKQSGLKYLQTLSDMDFRYSELYKVSLYYFTWVRDFVNAEASYGSLDRMGYNDQTSFFYMLLYFLVNFNETRLNNYLKSYNEAYGADYKYDIVTAMMNLYTKNVSTFDSIVRRLLAQDPYLFDKMFIEVNFEKF